MKRKIAQMAAAALLAVVAPGTDAAFAGEKDPKTTVSLVGYNRSQPVYRVEIRNPDNIRLNVVIRSVDGDILHQEAVQGTEITRVYRIQRQEIGRTDLFVEVSRIEDPLVSRIRLESKGGK